jgi:hypothetical protein
MEDLCVWHFVEDSAEHLILYPSVKCWVRSEQGIVSISHARCGYLSFGSSPLFANWHGNM